MELGGFEMDLKHINILGQKYRVTTKTPKGMPAELLENHYGICDRESNSIWINEKLNSEHKYRTLFHEMGHATFYRSGISFSGAIPMELEEIIVEVFASQQYEFLRDLIKGLVKHEPTEIKERLLAIISGDGKTK